MKKLYLAMIFIMSIQSCLNYANAQSHETLLNHSEILQTNKIQYGEWTPIRTQPVISNSFSQAAGQVPDQHIQKVNKIITALEAKQGMLLIRGEFGRLLIGEHDGLIKGMRPKIMSKSFQGSYLSEYATNNKSVSGKLSITKQNSNTLELLWASNNSSRSFQIYPKSGIIYSEWTNGPDDISIFTSAFPYEYIYDGENKVRFDQLIQKQRMLESKSNLALFGYRGSCLEIKTQNLGAASEEVWLNAGEITWVWSMNYINKNPNNKVKPFKPFGDWMRKNAAFVYPGGGAIRKISFKSLSPNGKIKYRISNNIERSLSDISKHTFKQEINAIQTKALVFKPEYNSLKTVKIWPNKFNGWKLRPLTWVQVNPMPRWFTIEINNNSYVSKNISFSLDNNDWLTEASIEYNPVTYSPKPGIKALDVPQFSKINMLNLDQDPLTLKAGEIKNISLKIQPKEASSGKYKFKLKWKSGELTGVIPLELDIEISGMISPMSFHPFNDPEDSRFFSYTHYSPNPIFFDWYYTGVDSSLQDKYFTLMGEDLLRKGFWTLDLAYLREYITAINTDGHGLRGGKLKSFTLPIEKYTENIRNKVILRKARQRYRFRNYLYDELHEIIGGYKGRRYMKIPEVREFTENIIKNSTTPCYPSFMNSGVDKGYHVKLPNDIAEMFYYTGRDEMFRVYASKLVNDRLTLVEEWKNNSEYMKKAGADTIRTLFSFWISAQLHVTDYNIMRRQSWYLISLGYNSISCWSMKYYDYLYSNKTIGNNGFVYSGENQRMMTDRSLAWYDIRDDMALAAQYGYLKEKADPELIAEAELFKTKAYDYSQKNNFYKARLLLKKACSILDKAKTVTSDFADEIKTIPLPDLLETKQQNKNSGFERKKTEFSKLLGGFRPRPSLNATLDNSYIEEGVSFNGFTILNSVS
ncbi:MAG: COG1470 family protein [Planctomycetota bacterium]|jgi:hypothetical protein